MCTFYYIDGIDIRTIYEIVIRSIANYYFIKKINKNELRINKIQDALLQGRYVLIHD